MPQEQKPLLIPSSQKRFKVLISIPTGDGWVHKHCLFALLKMQADYRVDKKIILPTHSPYVNNLHKIIVDFLNGDYDFWISFDDDNPPINNPIDLIFLNKDIIGCPTPVWANMKKGDYPIYWNALDAVEGGYTPHKEFNGLQKVDAIGSGCMVIARRVLQKMRYCQPFMREWNTDGTVEIGGDYNFCRKATKLGFEIYAHFDYPCLHFHEIEITEIAKAFQDLKTEE
jgi:hypothetical protein